MKRRCINKLFLNTTQVRSLLSLQSMKKIFVTPFVLVFSLHAQLLHAQQPDTVYNHKFSLHAQATVIPQYHFDFQSPYQGTNSVLPHEPVRTSFTGTLFAAYKPFKHTYIVFNPEVAGGKGLSKTLGIAGFPNGEIYRVGDPKPKPYIARFYIEQRFPLSSDVDTVEDDQNQVKEINSKNYISVVLGKFSLTDLFGNADFSHDPRSQFFNWSLMGLGGWDYPANTRGYNIGAMIQLIYNNWAFRYANTAMPTEANGPDLQWKGSKAMGQVFEVEKDNLFYKNDTHFSTVHAGIFWNMAHMGSYAEALAAGGVPDVTQSRQYGRSKWGYYAALDNTIGSFHPFIKTSWNDGNNESWAFTEIDASTALGFQLDGKAWHRSDDKLGLAYVQNNISNLHKEYLEKGGYGFLIGDGRLTYGPEQITELYYNMALWHHVYISPDYQFVINPAYNKDRGPVHIVSIRLHAEL